MENQFVTYNIASWLNKLGFTEDCLATFHKEFKTMPASFTRTNFFYELEGNIVDLREIVSAKKISLTYGYAIEIVLRNGAKTESGCYYTEEVLNEAYNGLVKKLTSL